MVQLDCLSVAHALKINFPKNREGYINIQDQGWKCLKNTSNGIVPIFLMSLPCYLFLIYNSSENGSIKIGTMCVDAEFLANSIRGLGFLYLP